MKQILILVFAAAAWAQTDLPGPVAVLPCADNSCNNPLNLQDQHYHYVGLTAPATVYQLPVSAATAASPMVLTLSSVPPTIAAGGSVTLSGALGAGCSGMNGTFAVSAVTTTTITATHNNAGCTYTASSAAISTDIYWELPDRTGAVGECPFLASEYVFAFGSCGAGGAPPFTDANPVLYSAAHPTEQLSFDVHALLAGAAVLKVDATGLVTAVTGGFALDCVRANATVAACLTNPLTTSGDIMYGGAFGTPTRLPIGSTGDVLQVSGGLPAWGPATFGSLTGVAYLTSGVVSAITGGFALDCVRANGTVAACTSNPLTTSGDIFVGGSFGTPTRLGIGSNGDFLTASGGALTWGHTISSLTLGSTSGVLYSTSGVVAPITTGFATDCVKANGTTAGCVTNPLTTTGDIFVGGSFGTPSRLAIGSSGDYLTVSGGTPAWASFGGTPVVTTRTISTTSPLAGGGDLSANRTLTIQVATTGQNGYLSSTDWNTFNGKITNPMTSAGDMISGTVAGVPVRLATGTAGQVLGLSCIGTCLPSWTTVTATSPITWSAYGVGCATCVTTAGGQSIAGTTTLSTANITTANITTSVAGIYDITGGFFGQDLTSAVTVSLAGGGNCQMYFKGGIIYATVYSGGGNCNGH